MATGCRTVVPTLSGNGLRRRGGAAATAALLTSLTVGGCVGVTDPIITLDQPGDGPGWHQDGAPVDNASRQRRLAEAKYADMDAALGYAEAAKAKYKQAVVNQSRLTNWTGGALIPLGAVALGIGAFGGSTTTAQVLGLAGAGILGTAYWFRSTPAQQAYSAGFTAVNCAIEVVLPLRAAGATKSTFTAARDRISGELADLGQNIQLVESAIDPTISPGVRERAQAALTIAREIQRAGEQARKSALAAGIEVANAPGQLVTTVDRISAQVDAAVMQNQAALEALPTIVGGLGQAYGGFSPVPLARRSAGTIEAPPPGAAQSGSVLDRLSALQDAAAKVARSTEEIAAFVNAISAATPRQKLEACGVDPSQFASALAADPAGPLSFVEGSPAARSFTVTGGTPPYGAQLATPDIGIELRQPEVFGPVFSVATTSAAKAGDHVVVVRDNAGRRLAIDVNVTASGGGRGVATGAAAAGGGAVSPSRGAAAAARGAGGDPEFANLDPQQRKLVQRALCFVGIEVDGIWGTNTENAIRAHQALRSPPETGPVSAATLRGLWQQDDATIAGTCGIAGPDELVRISQSLTGVRNIGLTRAGAVAAPAALTVTPDPERAAVVVQMVVDPRSTRPADGFRRDELVDVLIAKAGAPPSFRPRQMILANERDLLAALDQLPVAPAPPAPVQPAPAQ